MISLNHNLLISSLFSYSESNFYSKKSIHLCEPFYFLMSLFPRAIRLVILLHPLFVVMSVVSCENMDQNSLYASNARVKELAGQYYQGQNIFKQNCMDCHALPGKVSTDQFIFNNLFDRLPQPSEEYFAKYIEDSKQLKVSGNKYALDIAKAWHSAYEHNFKSNLSQKDIDNLIVYIKVAETRK